MHRQAVQTAFGRGSLAVENSRISTALTALQCHRGRQPFSTSAVARSDENENKRPSSRERSQAAASAISKLTGRPRSPARATAATRSNAPSGIDARALGNMIRSVPLDATKVVSLRNLRGPIGGMRGGRTGGLPEGGLRSRFAPRIGEGRDEAPRRPGGFRAGGSDGRSRPGGTSFRGRGARGARRGGERRPKAREAEGGKLKWSAEEKAVLDRLDQGEVTEYKPRVTLKDLSGYGPAVATDVKLGKIESAIQAMRIMGGGSAFNSDLSPTADYEGALQRYAHEKKPVFFNSVEEKRWVAKAWGKLAKVSKVDAATKKAVIETVVQGKYEMKAGFVDVTDTTGVVANYHGQTFSYKPSDSKAFLDKVQALLPAEAKAKPAAK